MKNAGALIGKYLIFLIGGVVALLFGYYLFLLCASLVSGVQTVVPPVRLVLPALPTTISIAAALAPMLLLCVCIRQTNTDIFSAIFSTLLFLLSWLVIIPACGLQSLRIRPDIADTGTHFLMAGGQGTPSPFFFRPHDTGEYFFSQIHPAPIASEAAVIPEDGTPEADETPAIDETLAETPTEVSTETQPAVEMQTATGLRIDFTGGVEAIMRSDNIPLDTARQPPFADVLIANTMQLPFVLDAFLRVAACFHQYGRQALADGIAAWVCFASLCVPLACLIVLTHSCRWKLLNLSVLLLLIFAVFGLNTAYYATAIFDSITTMLDGLLNTHPAFAAVQPYAAIILVNVLLSVIFLDAGFLTTLIAKNSEGNKSRGGGGVGNEK